MLREPHVAARQSGSDATGPAQPIGRELALAAIIDALKIALNGRARTCLITGEAGVGKTRLMQEVLERARPYDCHILSGRAQEYDHGIAHASLRDLLSSAMPDDYDEASRAALGSVLTALDVTAFASGPETQESEPGQPAYLLMTGLLRSLCASRPTVVALDDAHLSDDETLVALSFAVRHLSRMPLLVVVSTRLDTWQPGSRFAATLGRIIDSGGGTVVELDPLDRDDSRALIALDLPGWPDERLAAYVYSQSRGNPLFTRLALRALGESSAIRSEHGRCYLVGNPAPGALSRRAALLHRVFQQDRPGRELARVMSAFKRVRVEQIGALEAATGMERGRIERAFDALIRAGILVQVSAGSYEFAHPLIAEVLYNDLGPLERRRLHKLIAESLGSRPLTGEAEILEWTTHIAEAAAPGDQAALAAVMEAARLTRNTAPLSAATWYERALYLLPAESPDRGDLLARQAVAFWKGSRPESAVEVGLRALSSQGQSGQRSRTLATVINATYAMGRYIEALDLVSARVHEVRNPAPFLAQRALLLAHTGQGALAATQLREAGPSISAVSPRDQVVTYSYVGHTSNCLGDYRTARAAIDRLVAIGEDTATTLAHGTRLSALESAAYLLAGTGALSDSRQLLAKVAQLLPETGWQDVGGQYVYTKAKIEHLSGSWADALETIRAGAIRLEFAGLRNNLAWLRLLEAEILTDQARLDEAAQILDEPLLTADCVLYGIMHECRVARIKEALGNLDEAREIAQAQLALAQSSSLAGDAMRKCLELLVDVNIAAGDVPVAASYAREYQALAAWSDMPATVTAADLADLAVGEITEGDRLVAEYEAEGRLFAAAQAHLYLSATQAEPERHLLRALELFTAMDAQLWISRVSAQAKQSGVAIAAGRRQRVGGHGRTTLSDTEVQLVQLLRQGLTNREISAVLHYSAKTIEVYVSRLYQKVGCRSRLELVLAAERGEIAGLPADARRRSEGTSR